MEKGIQQFSREMFRKIAQNYVSLLSRYARLATFPVAVLHPYLKTQRQVAPHVIEA